MKYAGVPMKPRPYVQIQAFFATAATVVLLGVLAESAALPAAIFLTLGLCIWLYFMGRYRWLLWTVGDRRSSDRHGKDRVMAACLVSGLVVPTALAWTEFALSDVDLFAPPLQGGAATVLTISILAIPLGIFVSSAVDWYLIRPFREGVHNEPVCRSEVHRNGRAMDYARYWIMHRMVSEFVVYVGIVILVGLGFAVIAQAVQSEQGKGAVSFIGGLGIAVWALSELSGLRAALNFVRYPHCELGSWAEGRTENCADIAGFVLDVSIKPGVQLIESPRGYPARDIADKRHSVPLRQAYAIKTVDPPRPICSERCEFWIPDCEMGLRELEES